MLKYVRSELTYILISGITTILIDRIEYIVRFEIGFTHKHSLDFCNIGGTRHVAVSQALKSA
jgi:hypothetical protein